MPPVDELNMRQIEWVIINRDNMEQKLAELTAGGAPLALFVLTAKGYENLGLNISDIRALLQQQQQIILSYERYYKESNDSIDAANAEIERAASRPPAPPERKKVLGLF